jgi:hypothetical protein
MKDKNLERAIELGKRVEHAFSSPIGADNFPHVNCAREIEQVTDRDDEGREIPFCTYAPEWAEHARSGRSDDACDDGRAGEA